MASNDFEIPRDKRYGEPLAVSTDQQTCRLWISVSENVRQREVWPLAYPPMDSVRRKRYQLLLVSCIALPCGSVSVSH